MRENLEFIGTLLLLSLSFTIFILVVFALGIVATLLLSHIGRRTDMGQDYIDAKTSSLIAGKKRTITKLRNRMPADDLFGLGKAECEANIAGIQAEIDALERGEFNYYVPATYINKIKQYIYI
ncbi:hypothetical protein [uncultured Duncaniella sp.]|uniref:hypothetical protein n=1 Tax=uncultured Duncaniella sp. TaxID=2768039 RepID=UPI0025B6A572|nr:hypothetical protein [uncultured Duncaniella sp.]